MSTANFDDKKAANAARRRADTEAEAEGYPAKPADLPPDVDTEPDEVDRGLDEGLPAENVEYDIDGNPQGEVHEPVDDTDMPREEKWADRNAVDNSYVERGAEAREEAGE